MTVPATTLQIRLSSGARFEVTIQDVMEQINVFSVKEKISTLQEDCPPERQRLIYKGTILADDRTLSDYGVVNGATLHLVKSAAAATTTANRASTSTSTTTTPPNPFASHSQQQGMPPNPFAASQQPPNPFGGMPMPPPDQMQEIMNSPMMQSIMDSPELMRTMMEANPQMRQLMQENPQLREVMNNPEMLRQSMEMMRNPNAMQHMMRSQDLAMSQLENMYVQYLSIYYILSIYIYINCMLCVQESSDAIYCNSTTLSAHFSSITII
jgi:ubiquilin